MNADDILAEVLADAEAERIAGFNATTPTKATSRMLPWRRGVDPFTPFMAGRVVAGCTWCGTEPGAPDAGVYNTIEVDVGVGVITHHEYCWCAEHDDDVRFVDWLFYNANPDDEPPAWGTAAEDVEAFYAQRERDREDAIDTHAPFAIGHAGFIAGGIGGGFTDDDLPF